MLLLRVEPGTRGGSREGQGKRKVWRGVGGAGGGRRGRTPQHAYTSRACVATRGRLAGRNDGMTSPPAPLSYHDVCCHYGCGAVFGVVKRQGSGEMRAHGVCVCVCTCTTCGCAASCSIWDAQEQPEFLQSRLTLFHFWYPLVGADFVVNR
jgi:hypothetical protein